MKKENRKFSYIQIMKNFISMEENKKFSGFHFIKNLK